MDILTFEEKPITDEMIEEYEYHEYETITGTNLNNAVEGRLMKDDDRAFADADVITLTNNGIMHLFSNIKYQLTEQEVESLYYPS